VQKRFAVGIVTGIDPREPSDIALLQEAKDWACAYLIACVEHSPEETLLQRMGELKRCKYIDRVLVYSSEEQLQEILKRNAKTNGGCVEVRIVGPEFVGHDTALPLCHCQSKSDYQAEDDTDRAVA
jgi:hypothetical protein